jgi:hypothetical protein
MSVFQVRLNNANQGKMDVDVNRAQRAVSLQRTVYIMGPNKVNRKLKDGDSFTDSNYYKRFCYPQVPLDQAILVCTSDDGSVYSDDGSIATYPKVYHLSCDAGSTYTDNVANIATDTGSYATFVQVTNTHASQSINVKINGVTDAYFTLKAGDSQAFDQGDLQITKIEVDNSASGNVASVTAEVICSIKSISNS